MVYTSDLEGLTKDKVISLMVGRDMKEIYPPNHTWPGESVFQLKEFTKAGVFQNINLTLRRGEILGIAGLIGAGRTEIFRAVFGLDRYDSGEIYLEGQLMQIHSVYDAVQQGIVMIPEDRKGEGLVLCRSVAENISLPNLDKYKTGVINDRIEHKNADTMIKKLSIKTPSEGTAAGSLSGGNQQKIVISKWLLHSPKILIMDVNCRIA